METIALSSNITPAVAAASATTTVVAELSTVTQGLAMLSAPTLRADLASSIYLENTPP